MLRGTLITAFTVQSLYLEVYRRRGILEIRNSVLIVSTMDTKADEACFLKKCLEGEDLSVKILDAGIKGDSPFPVDISRHSVANAAGSNLGAVQHLGHEGKALNVMISGAIKYAEDLYEKGDIQGVIGIGGSMGTSLGTAVMRIFPVGFPKVMISTMASRNTRPFVGTKDIMMLHSVCDLSGLNRITGKVLREGALALAGMVKGSKISPLEDLPLVVLSTLGTTEACALMLRKAFGEKGREVLTFHTVGSGGEAMDEIVREENVELVVDLSLHELIDNFFGGDYDAGPDRGIAALEKGIPTVLVPGNTDFLVTGPLSLAKERFAGRLMHAHNSAITAVGTNQREMETLAKHISEMCRKAKGPVEVLVPMGGFSAFDSTGGPLEDPDVRRKFAKVLRLSLPGAIPYIESGHHINDPEFAMEIMDCANRMMQAGWPQP
jgi:uncharacterized protein (UPF0261 family)